MIAKLLQRKTATAGGGGGGAFTPSQLTGLQRWYSATDVVTSGTNVTQFNDKSGGTNHATQATGTKQPILKTNQGSGFQTVSFDGVDDIINFASMTLTGDFTIYWIGFMREADGSGGGFFGEADASLNSLNTYLQGTYWYTASGDIAQGNNNAITNGLFCELVARRTGTTVTIEVNGVTNSTSGPVNANPVIGQIGRVYTGYAKVDLAEFLVYNQYHDNATKAQVLSWADGIYLDPYFDKVSLLLHMDGTNGSTSFVDSGPNALAVTAAGNAQVSNSSKFGTGAVAFDGNGDYLDISSNPVNFGTGDFTVECWVYLYSVAKSMVILRNSTTGGFYFRIGQSFLSAANGLNVAKNGQTDNERCAFSFVANTWYHVAVTRQSGTVKFFVDGTQQTTTSSGYNGYSVPSGGSTRIGLDGTGTIEAFNGLIDDLRVTKGVARTITVPTAAFPDLYNPFTTLPVSGAALWLSAPQTSSLYTDAGATNVIKDGDAVYQWNDLSGNNRHATQTTLANRPTWLPPAKGRSGLGALAFNGSQFLSVSSPNADYGTGDFTVEFWFKATSTPTDYAQICGNYQASSYMGFGLIPSSGTKIYATTLATGYTGTTNISTNTWYHAAFVRSSGTLKMYLNGVLDGTYTVGTSFNTPSWQVGGSNNGQKMFTGQIQNLLAYKGQALYTSNFTPWMS